MVLYIIIFIISLLWLNTLANRIRQYGSNPWVALWALIPFVNIVLGLYYGIVKGKNKEI
jgi:succinate dehydrogenase hydrophobic anchor subunit